MMDCTFLFCLFLNFLYVFIDDLIFSGAQFISHQKQAKNEGNTKLVGTLKSVIEGIQKFNDNHELSTESSLGKLEKLISKLRTFIAINVRL